MTSLFRSRGFDSLIGKGTVIHGGQILIAANATTLVEGAAYMDRILGDNGGSEKVAAKTTLHVAGIVAGPTGSKELEIDVHNVIITGQVVCKTIRVEGTLAVKAGAMLKADKILYRELIAETGAVIHGQMGHLDHVSEGEVV